MLNLGLGYPQFSFTTQAGASGKVTYAANDPLLRRDDLQRLAGYGFGVGPSLVSQAKITSNGVVATISVSYFYKCSERKYPMNII